MVRHMSIIITTPLHEVSEGVRFHGISDVFHYYGPVLGIVDDAECFGDALYSNNSLQSPEFVYQSGFNGGFGVSCR